MESCFETTTEFVRSLSILDILKRVDRKNDAAAANEN